MRKRVYLAGPVTKGDRSWNQYQASCAHKMLIQAGYAVYNPVTSGVLPFAWDGDIDHETWLENCLPWVAVCDLLIRLPGESQGADVEAGHARSLHIPVFEVASLDHLRDWLNGVLDYICPQMHEVS